MRNPQHAIVYNSSSEVYFGNDGGVWRSTNGGTTIGFKATNYNVTQYYACAIHPTLGSNQFMAGAQDNGTQQYSIPGINSTVEVAEEMVHFVISIRVIPITNLALTFTIIFTEAMTAEPLLLPFEITTQGHLLIRAITTM